MAMNLQPGPRFVPGMNMGMEAGMPAGMAQLLQEKYRQSGMVAAANAAQANAAAALQRQQAGTWAAESAAKIKASDAAAFLDREKGGAIKPALDLDRDKFYVWKNDTESNIRFRDAATENQRINNRALPRQLATKQLLGEEELKYYGPKAQAEIRGMDARSALDRSGVGVNERNARDPLLSPGQNTRDQRSSNEAPAPNASAAAPSSTLGSMDLSGSNNVWGGKPVQAVGPTGGGGGWGDSAMAPVGASAPVLATPMGDTAGLVAPIISPRRAPSSLFASLDNGGGGGLLDGSFLNNRLTLSLKRGTARVPGKGSGDKVPAMLEPGEAILNKHAAGMIGRDKIAKANTKGNMQRQRETVGKVAQMLRQMGMM